jgi:histidinol dehydrogenase
MDMLAQAEHDPSSRSMLFASSEILAEAVIAELQAANVSELLSRVHILLFESLDECVDAANRIAPEHLQLMVVQPEAIRQKLTEYGALFEGYDTTVPLGDYMAGPNHTLPTGRSARFSEGLNPRTFLRAQSYLRSSGSMETIASDTAEFAEVEGLSFHAKAASARKSD